MSKPITPDRFDELAATPEGLRKLDEAGFAAITDMRKRICSDGSVEWNGDRRLHEGEAPPIFSHAPDAPDRWRWRGELMEAVLALGDWNIDIDPNRTYPYFCGHNELPCIWSDSLPLALGKAMAAANLLFEED